MNASEFARTSGPQPTSDGTLAAFFDVDNTIIRGASAFHLSLGLRRRGFLRWRDLLHFTWMHLCYQFRGEDEDDITSIRQRSLELMQGRAVADVVAVGEQVWDEVWSARVYPGARLLIDAHRDSGHAVWLVTATPLEVGELIGRRLGADGVLATVGERVNGFYTGRLVGPLMHGKEKAVAIERLAGQLGFDLGRCYAYGDSANDVDMLRLVGKPCAINPDRHLRRYCLRRAWPVREFTVRQRATRRSLRTASRLGGVWAVMTIVRSLARRLRGR